MVLHLTLTDLKMLLKLLLKQLQLQVINRELILQLHLILLHLNSMKMECIIMQNLKVRKVLRKTSKEQVDYFEKLIRNVPDRFN